MVLDNLKFVCLWEPGRDEDREKVKILWRKYRALEAESHIEKRSREIVYVVKNTGDEAIAVSTARPVQAPFLNNHHFYEFRCFIDPSFRIPGLDSLLAVKTKTFLEQQKDSVTKFKGILMIIENEALRSQRTKAVWNASQMVFMGYNSKGHHIRVGYFKGARI
jgi:hypothetical protein